MVDIHSHLIWDIDDGSKSKEMTLNMLKIAVESGTKKIVSTPHYIPGHYETTYEEVKEKIEKVKVLAKENNLDIEIYQGQEVYYTSNILENYENGYIGTINNSRYMLIEFNMKNFSISEVLENLYELKLKGIVPVIAHPERYHIFIKKNILVNKFIEEGFLFQLNTGSITGDFGSEVKKTAEIFIKNKIYNFIGSDAHRDEKRTTDMTKGLEIIKKTDKNYVKELKKFGEKLLNNEEIKFTGELIKEKKGLFSFIRKG
ncbi:exopolysaccharide biosynthesis protein [Clostridium carnis]